MENSMTRTDIHLAYKKEFLVATYEHTLIYNLNLEPWELSNILLHLNIDGTNFSKDDLIVKGHKNYDEDGNSYHEGILLINAYNHTREDFKELAKVWDEAEQAWESTLS